MKSFAPISAQVIAIALPIPEEAPVTNMRLPSMENGFISFLL